MYEKYFRLNDKPFQLTPDPKFWVETATHKKAMAYLGYGLAQGEGFIVITGDIGAGKTTLVAHLMNLIDPANLNPIHIVSSAIEADDLLRIVAGGLGVDGERLSKAELLKLIERGLHAVARTGRRTLLIVDEAQTLPVSALEELRMLSNFQAGGRAIVQILLLGQPEFRDRLHGSEPLEQLRQRVIALHHLDPMRPDEIATYIGHRLQVAGWKGNPDFADDAFPVLFRATDGVPRRLNQLMGRVMLHAAMSEATLIDAAMINAVRADAARETPARPAAVNAGATAAPVPESGIALRLAALEAKLGTPSVDAGLADRMAALEARIEEQDAALRRVLTLLVDWVEGDGPQNAKLEAVRGAAA